MFITGLGTALPPNRYSQKECWTAVQLWEGFQRFAPRSRAILRKVLTGDNGIETRHLALDSLADAFTVAPDFLHARFKGNAPRLAAQAGERALQSARVDPEQVDAVIISTCTGYLCPGLTSFVAEQLALRRDVLALDLVGQGCGAAVPNLRTGEALVRSGNCRRVLSICVEVCSAAIYFDDDPGVLISACLFGDGAGAAVLSAEPSPDSRKVRWRTAGTVLDTANRDLLRFELRDGMLRNILTSPVPAVAARHAHELYRQVLRRVEVRGKEISQWVFHAGGRDVLEALRAQFELNPAALAHSAQVLREVGNISSPFVLHVLERALKSDAPGGLWWLASFGAGFSSHGVLLEVE